MKEYFEHLINEDSSRGESEKVQSGKHEDDKVKIADGVSIKDGDGKEIAKATVYQSSQPAEKEGKVNGRVKYCVDEPTDDEILISSTKTPDTKKINELFLTQNKSAVMNRLYAATGAGGAREAAQKAGEEYKGDGAFIVFGEAGWGKTSIIKDCAKKFGLHIITVYLDKALPEDLGGIPTKATTDTGDDYVKLMLPAWAAYMKEHEDTNFLLFFDEINQASGEVQNTLMPITLEHEVCGIKFKNFIVAGAGNYSSENNYLIPLSKPLLSRFGTPIQWNCDWADSRPYLREKFNDAFDKTYKAKFPKEDDYTKDEFVDPLEAIIRFPIWKNPRDIEIHVIRPYAAAQYRAKTGIIGGLDQASLDRPLMGYLKHYVFRDDFTGYDWDDKQIDMAGKNKSEMIVKRISEYFADYYKWLAGEGEKERVQNGEEVQSKMSHAFTGNSNVEGVTQKAYDSVKKVLTEKGIAVSKLVDFFNGADNPAIKSHFMKLNNGIELTQEMVTNIIEDSKKRTSGNWYNDIINKE